jgi:hypothetical protein
MTSSRPKDGQQHSSSPQYPLRRRSQRHNDVATILAYDRFCRQYTAYRHSMSNQIRIFEWIDERRIEMRDEGRPHWVPSTYDFERAVRDCGDDLVSRPIAAQSECLQLMRDNRPRYTAQH